QHGYYTARIRTVGARGDFSTTATLSAQLGSAIAAWLLAEAKATDVTTIIEVGGGDGPLMKSVLSALGWWQRRRFRVLMVEASPVLMKQQQDKLKGRVQAWFGTLPEALQACEGEALIFSNELLDAFPVDLVHWDGDAWQEVWIDGGREVLVPLTILRNPFSALRSTPAKPQRYELATALHSWLHGWLPHWQRGSMLTIDYGDEFPAVYHRRPRGTLRAYLFQQRLEGADVYANPGRQDITCDVNFTDWRAWLTDAGLSEMFYEKQAAFLQRGGQVKSQADHFVQEVGGAGTAFQCHAVRRV
ncbi:MAG: SAM-dependent methyltransferase, partial [Verrucomicrobiaceae bacterium]